jgi:acetylornithine deacetylase
MEKKPLELLESFVNISSPSGSEKQFAEHLYQLLDTEFDHDYLELQQVAPDRHNVIMSKGVPALTLTSHIDTVPTQIVTRVEGKKLFGTGACDAKGQVVTQLYAMKSAIAQGLKNYGCFYVVGEEVDSIGAAATVDNPSLSGRYVLNGEPTGNKFVKESKGVMELSVGATGTEQHSSIVPFDSAIHKLIGGLNGLIESPPSGSTVNVGVIEGGKAANMSAADASANVNLRISKASSAILAHVKDSLGGLTINVDNAIEPFSFYVPPEFEASAINVSFCSDSSYYASNYRRVMMFGPGDITVAHSINEYIDGEQVDEAIQVIGSLLLYLEEDLR